MKRIFAILFYISVLPISNFSAQVNGDDCKKLLKQHTARSVFSEAYIDGLENPCYLLATWLHDEFQESRLGLSAEKNNDASSLKLDFLTPRSLQSSKVNNPNSVASASQSDAIPSLYPFALAGGTIGGAGSNGGTNALTAVSINPAMFFADMSDAKESAKWGRLMDLSVIFPLNNVESDNNQNLDYLGLRGRINLTGVEKGDELFEKVLLNFNDVLETSKVEIDVINDILIASNNCEACFNQFLKVINEGQDASTIATICGKEFSIKKGDEEFKSFKEELDNLLSEADRKYFGLDLRADFGDPTLNAVDSASGTSMFLGIGYGFSGKGIKGKGAFASLNSRLGIRYKDMEVVDASLFDIDGALGIDLSWPYQFQQIKLGIGFEFRANLEEKLETIVETDLSEAYETDYLYFRLALNIPITATNGISLQYGTAIAGEKASILSFNFSWNLLLED